MAPSAPDHAEGVVTGLHRREALDTLSERDREALQLIGWEGLDTQQAARVVGCSARAFAVRRADAYRPRRRRSWVVAVATVTALAGAEPVRRRVRVCARRRHEGRQGQQRVAQWPGR